MNSTIVPNNNPNLYVLHAMTDFQDYGTVYDLHSIIAWRIGYEDDGKMKTLPIVHLSFINDVIDDETIVYDQVLSTWRWSGGCGKGLEEFGRNIVDIVEELEEE